MTSIKTIARFASLAAVLAAATAGSVQASETPGRLTMKPLQGISFDAGSQRAVSYFTSENGACELVVTLAGEPDWDHASSLTISRFEATVSPDHATKFRPHTGKVLEFFCEAGAAAMSVTGVEEVAAGSFR